MTIIVLRSQEEHTEKEKADPKEVAEATAVEDLLVEGLKEEEEPQDQANANHLTLEEAVVQEGQRRVMLQEERRSIDFFEAQTIGLNPKQPSPNPIPQTTTNN